MPNRKIKHIVAKLVGASTEETLDVYDVDAIHTDKIYNALDQTAAGYVLDARQGKALNDSIGNLSDYLSYSADFGNQLFVNGSESGINPTSSYAVRRGNIAQINFYFNTTVTKAGYSKLMTLPAALKPATEIQVILVNYAQHYAYAAFFNANAVLYCRNELPIGTPYIGYISYHCTSK